MQVNLQGAFLFSLRISLLHLHYFSFSELKDKAVYVSAVVLSLLCSHFALVLSQTYHFLTARASLRQTTTTFIMLLNSGSNAPAHWGEPLGYNTETLLDDVSKQMAASNIIRRHSRGASGQRGGSMRIVKTGSAGVSPRSSTMLSRRRTLMTDSSYRRKPLSFDQNGMATVIGNDVNDRMQPPSLANRPVSWHASSHLAPQSSYISSMGYPMPKSEFNGAYDNQELLSTPAVYSGYASPASTFSPLSQPFTDYRQQAFQYTDDSCFPNNFNTVNNGYAFYPPPEAAQQPEALSYSASDNVDPSMYSHFNWDNFAANGFDSSTAPPTPENFLPIQQPDPSFEAEEAIPYHLLEDSEPGEVLIGMGLYDAPEKSPEADPQLDNYKALMMSQLLGTPYRKQEAPTATGKGLKLEETWNPPPSDDGDDDDEDGDNEEDADGSEADAVSEEASTTPAEINGTAMYNNQIIVNTGHGLEQGRNGWL
jgi:hypothetical protein